MTHHDSTQDRKTDRRASYLAVLFWLAIALLCLVVAPDWSSLLAKSAHTHQSVPAAARPAASLAPADTADDFFAADLAWWWPENAADAARVYQCAPATSRDTQDSVVVWTDKANKVVVFGAAFEGGQIPAYAMVLGQPAGADAMPVRVAVKGYQVKQVGKTHLLKLKDQQLGCTPSIDE
jgi:hypothetical protein